MLTLTLLYMVFDLCVLWLNDLQIVAHSKEACRNLHCGIGAVALHEFEQVCPVVVDVCNYTGHCDFFVVDWYDRKRSKQYSSSPRGGSMTQVSAGDRVVNEWKAASNADSQHSSQLAQSLHRQALTTSESTHHAIISKQDDAEVRHLDYPNY